MPMERDIDHTDEWSHMSDYDDAGVAPGEGNSHNMECWNTTIDNPGEQEHRDKSGLRATLVRDAADDTRACEWKNGGSDEVFKELQEKAKQIDKQLEVMSGIVACFSRGNQSIKRGNKKDQYDDEESDDGEDGRLVCNMTGQGWEVLPFPVVVASGAIASVMPQDWCPHVPTTPTKESEQGEYFRAANGSKIYNQGQKMITMMTQEGAQRDMRFTVCDVSKALASSSYICVTLQRLSATCAKALRYFR